MPRAKGQLTKKQQIGTQGIRSTIPLTVFSEDEVKLLLSYLWHWDIATDQDNNPKLVRASKSCKPAMAIGQTNYCRLRYKLENFLTPKNL
ncbi:hypothetical protein PseudUWO311_00570 [Pseudanabaena sp. UWO311]|uniref:hypothetical protein n=1 Tax=Pseudanabaena sp. UWO311 TaxID=2487337 RepID=UPI00115AFD3B|nr:hypothetical protein [Pseudanabaena sp. UWO311]TYQ29424.1 hypothetical protein PseudUWO311_00570 [Pseudanabaena sp. UWO311]